MWSSPGWAFRPERPFPSENLVTRQDVPSGHKVAARFIRKGEPVLKYNTVIGFAGDDLEPGTHMHSHNIFFDEVEKDYAFSRDYKPTDFVPEGERATFQGIVRENGQVATRNYVGVFVVGNLGATTARKIANAFTPDRLADYPNVDGVVPYVHQMGHGMERTGEAMDLLRRTIGGYIRHPNTAAALVIAQGYEVNDLDDFLNDQRLEVGPRLKTLVVAEAGGLRKAVEEGKRLVAEMLPLANQATRQTASAEHIMWACSAAARTASPACPQTRRSAPPWTSW